MEALRLDKNGACYIVFPDCPAIDFPNVNYFWIFSMIAFGQIIAKRLNIKSFGMPEFLAFCFIIYLIACFFLYFVFF